ncbi:AraC family transcriptional regulator [Cohnella luojiensis]|uniref:AraC family transcriptional regulator n=1 Tax=Cohnella luojiensis TaxID=652876 RepID=A0A4Y8M2A8_9BACL|nr:AraC family transcriptional regulator [Cohnella luojiensis]TFE28941.1 AraC family transcriptional regulator [Cohnella luojiensis]
MNSNWFRRLLLSYLPMFFIVITILFFVFFQTLNEQNRKEAIKANEFLTQQVIRFTDNSLKTVDYRVLRDILSAPVLKRFFSTDSNDVYESIEATKLMDDWKFNYQIIDSIYFLRLQDHFILGDGSGLTSDFLDAPFINPYVEQTNIPGKWTGKRVYTTYPNEKPSEVITMVQGYPRFTNKKSGYIVVNVSLSKLKRSIAPMYNSDLTFVRMKDVQGGSLLGDDTGNQKNPSVFSRYISPYTGWEVTSGPVDKGILRIVLHFYNVWLIMAIAAVILGVLWVVHVSRRNYKPISQLVSLIRTSSLINQDVGKPDKNEFGFIRGALEHLMEETKKTRQQNNENMILQKKHRFQEAVEGSFPIRETEWQADLIKYNVNPAGSYSFVLVLDIDRYRNFTETFKPHDQSILKFVVSSVVHEMAQLSEASAWAEWTADRRLSAIVWVPENENSDGLSDIIGEQIVEWIRGNLGFSVTLGIDGMAIRLEEIRRSHEIASNLLQYKAVLGTGRLIRSDEVNSSQSRIHEYFGTIHSLSQAMRLPENAWHKHLEDLFKQIKDSVSSRKEIESLLQFLQQQLSRVFLEMSREYRIVWKDKEAEWLELEKSWETVEELEGACGRIFEEMSDKMQVLRDSQKTRVVIGDIRSYIEENYGNPELSLDYLSDKFMMQTKNISKLFKEEFGENFVDFLIGLRIENAKKLFLETDKSLQEISAEIGYYNYNSFNRAFRNVAGISPSDYRKQAFR